MPAFSTFGFIPIVKELLNVRSGTVLTAVTASTVKTTGALGFQAIVEEFGFDVEDILVGTGSSTATFTLKDGSDHVLATVVITEAAGAAGHTFSSTTITKTNNYHKLQDASVLKVVRTATGTAFTSGSGHFWVRLAVKAQQEA